VDVDLVTLSDFYRHFDACSECTTKKLCAIGDDVLRRATDDTAARMAGVQVIDLPGHKETCLECRPLKLCHVGSKIAEAQALAIVDAADDDWRIKRPT
jgi:hypothetical protein